MDTRYGANPNDFKHYTTEEIRDEFLITDLYQDDKLNFTYIHSDRMMVLGCKPKNQKISLNESVNPLKNCGAEYFLERREMGIFNLGKQGKITVDGTEYILEHKDCLYITSGHKDVFFQSTNKDFPAKFYMISAPSHISFETKFMPIKDVSKGMGGDAETMNLRTVNKFINPENVQTAQLSMGLTALEPFNNWSSIPAHTHERRMEIFTYFDMTDDDVIFHFMGEPSQTRHIVAKNLDVIYSPAWSIHTMCGTSNFGYIWAVSGENKNSQDSIVIKSSDLK